MCPGLEIRGCQEPRAALNSHAAPSNFGREPKDVLVSIQNTFRQLFKMQLGSLEKSFISNPGVPLEDLFRSKPGVKSSQVSV